MIRALALIVLVACGSRADEEIANRAREPAPRLADASLPAPVTPRDADQAWTAYRDAHKGATSANAVETGKKLWAMLAPDAQQIVADSLATTVGSLGKTGAKLDATDAHYRVLGESAAARASMMAAAQIAELTASPDEVRGTDKISRSHLVVKDQGTTLVFELVKTNDGPWLFAASPGLIATDTDVFKRPAGHEETTGAPTLDAVVAKWKQINATGTGWDAYNLMSPAMRRRILGMVASVGGNGAEDAARIFEKTLSDRRGRGMAITSTRITDQAADRASVEVNYSTGKSETATAVKVDGAWWIELAF